jgi:hypothetical protein
MRMSRALPSCPADRSTAAGDCRVDHGEVAADRRTREADRGVVAGERGLVQTEDSHGQLIREQGRTGVVAYRGLGDADATDVGA